MPLSPSRRQFLRILAAGAAYTGSGSLRAATTAFRSPYVQNLRENRATIRWSSTEPGDGTVELWDDSRTVREVKATMRAIGGRYRFEAVVKDLSPASSYGYRVAVGSERSAPAAFHTPGTPAFEFLAFGDSGTGSPEQKLLAERMLKHSPAFVAHTGDLVYPAGTFERYESLYFSYYEELMRQAPFFPCPGNHDYYETSCIPYRALHTVPGETVRAQDQGRYYSFDWGNAHFVSLDTNDSLFEAVKGTGDMLRWLDADLASSSKFWRIVVLHHSPYAEGAHSGEIEGKLIREHISPILAKHGVPLVLNGHEHSYQRSIPIRGTTYITTGGGGAPLHPPTPSPLVEKAAAEFHYLSVTVAGSKLRVRALRTDGTALDTWDLAPAPTIDSIVDAASFGTDVASGGLVSIFGHHLAADQATITVNGLPAAVLLASPNQINVELPKVTGDATLTLHGPNGKVERKLSISAVAPALFEGAVIHESGVPVTNDAPARAGDTLLAYGTGMGTNVTVEWNGTETSAQCAPVAGLRGVSAVKFVVPAGGGSGQFRVVAQGKASNRLSVPAL